MMFSSVNTYNFHSNIGKSTVSTMSNDVYDTHRDNGVNPKLLLGHVLTIFKSSWGMGVIYFSHGQNLMGVCFMPVSGII